MTTSGASHSSDERLEPVQVRSTADEVAGRLREAIVTGRIAPGEHLIERRLGTELGVSNIALREAFFTLAEEGLIVRIPRRGAFAASFTAEEIHDLAEVRTLIEQRAVLRTVARWTPSIEREAESVLGRMAAAARAVDAHAVSAADKDFHMVFLVASGNRILEELALNLQGRVARSLRQALLASSDRKALLSIVESHQIWLDAARSGDEQLILAVVAKHIEGGAKSIATGLAAAFADVPEALREPAAGTDPTA